MRPTSAPRSIACKGERCRCLKVPRHWRFNFWEIRMETNERRLLKKDDASRILAMPQSTLEKLTSRKQIPHLKIGAAVYYDTADLWAWIESKKSASCDVA